MRFGGLTAVQDLSVEIGDGELVGMIGPNGAGKTTVFNMITGVYQPTEGGVKFCTNDIVGKEPFEITACGIARTFQNIRLFPSMTVFDNLRVAFNKNLDHGFSTSLLKLSRFHREEKAVAEEIMKFLEMFGLGDARNNMATSLPYGDQRKLEIVRALATHPKLLLLDEPAAGLNPTEKKNLMLLIEHIQEELQIAVLLIEHDMKVVMGVCKRIFVLDYGVKIAEGAPEEIRNNARVIEAYLGK